MKISGYEEFKETLMAKSNRAVSVLTIFVQNCNGVEREGNIDKQKLRIIEIVGVRF